MDIGMGGQEKPWEIFQKQAIGWTGFEGKRKKEWASGSPILQPKGSRTSLAAGRPLSTAL